MKYSSAVITDKCFGASKEGKPLANPAKLCASSLFFLANQPPSHSTSQLANWPASQPAQECPWCHLRIMGKECSQLLSVLIISDVEEMEGLWADASPAEPWGEEEEEEEGAGGQEGAERGEKG